MKYNELDDAFIKCYNCGNYVDKDSLLCKKCGADLEKERLNVKTDRTKASREQKKYS